MTPSHIQELRELADAIEADGAWALHNDATVTAALRACADREERAQAGITDDLAAEIGMRVVEAGWPLIPVSVLRAALQSAALALQGDDTVDAKRYRYIRSAASCGDDLDAVLLTERADGRFWKRYAFMDEAVDNAIAADLSRTIGDEK